MKQPNPSHHITGNYPLRLADSQDRATLPAWLVGFQRGFERLEVAVYGDSLTGQDAIDAAIEFLKISPDQEENEEISVARLPVAPSSPAHESLRVIVTNAQGAEQCRCTLAEFVRDNQDAWPLRLRGSMASNIAERIAALGADTLHCGAGGVFTIRAEPMADPYTERLIAELAQEIAERNLCPLDSEQLALLRGPDSEDRTGMLEDLRDRVGLDVQDLLDGPATDEERSNGR